MILVSDEELLLKIAGESSNILGYRAKYENLVTKGLMDEMARWAVVNIIDTTMKNQKLDYLENRPNKIKEKLKNKLQINY